MHISGASRAGRRLCTTTDDTPKDVKEKDPAVRRPKLWQLDGSFQGDLSAFHDAVVSHTSAHSTQDQGKRGKKAQRFMRISMCISCFVRFSDLLTCYAWVSSASKRCGGRLPLPHWRDARARRCVGWTNTHYGAAICGGV